MDIGQKYLIHGDIFIVMESSYDKKLACLVDVTNYRVFDSCSLGDVQELVSRLGGVQLNDGKIRKLNTN